jgi:hypothetical protein
MAAKIFFSFQFLILLLFVGCRIPNIPADQKTPSPALTPTWTNVNRYVDSNQVIQVKTGERFAIGAYVFAAGGFNWEERHNKEYINLED